MQISYSNGTPRQERSYSHNGNISVSGAGNVLHYVIKNQLLQSSSSSSVEKMTLIEFRTPFKF
jgi:hypothetical protein